MKTAAGKYSFFCAMLLMACTAVGEENFAQKAIRAALISQNSNDKINAAHYIGKSFDLVGLELALEATKAFLEDADENIRIEILLHLAASTSSASLEAKEFNASIYEYLILNPKKLESFLADDNPYYHRALHQTARASMSEDKFHQWENESFLIPIQNAGKLADENKQLKAAKMLTVVSGGRVQFKWIERLLFSQYIEVRNETISALHLMLLTHHLPDLADDIFRLKSRLLSESYEKDATTKEYLPQLLSRVDEFQGKRTN